MEKREIRAIINIEDVIKNTDVSKVLRCYDFKQWEQEEILSLNNDTNMSLNEFRWEYVRGTLELTDSNFLDIGFMVKDLIEDIKMGYHNVSDDLVIKDIENSEKVHEMYNDLSVMAFEYEPLRNYETQKITHIEIYYREGLIPESKKEEEITELLTYLELNKDKLSIFFA